MVNRTAVNDTMPDRNQTTAIFSLFDPIHQYCHGGRVISPLQADAACRPHAS